MIDNDFLIFWLIGDNILHGLDPYAVSTAYYPPAIFLLFTLFALLPVNVSYSVWSSINAVLLVRTLSQKMPLKKTFLWFAFSPITYVFLTGQLDIVFLTLVTLLGRKGWPAIIAASLLTLKPQIALVVLPWTLINWLLKDIKSLIKFTGLTIVLWGIPLLLSPTIYQRWYLNTNQVVENYTLNSPGLFSLAYFPIPVVLLAVVALGIVLYGLTLGRTGSLVANFLATPIGIWYNTALLAGSVPWQWVIPISWVAFVLAALVKAAYPLALIPAAAFLWMIRNREKVRDESEPMVLPLRIFAKERL